MVFDTNSSWKTRLFFFFFLRKYLVAVPRTDRMAVSLWLLSCSHGALTALIIILEQQQTRINQGTAQMAGDCFHCSEFPVALFSLTVSQKGTKNRNQMHLKTTEYKRNYNVYNYGDVYSAHYEFASSTDWMLFLQRCVSRPMMWVLI